MSPAPGPVLPSAPWLRRAPLLVGASVLILLGIVPQTLGAIRSGQPPFLRIALVEPALLLGACALLALARPPWLSRALDSVSVWGLRIRHKPLLALLAVWTFAMAAGFGWYCFRGQPVVSDEMSQRFQASVLLDGRLSAVAEPASLAAFFGTAQTAVVEDRWFSEFPIGGPALLAIAGAVRAEWLLNPFLAAVSLLLFFGIARRSFGEAAGRLAVALFALSPFVLFMSGSQMNHPMALAAQLAAVYGLSRWETSTGRAAFGHAALIGGGLGAMATLRPYDAALIALPIAVFQLTRLRRDAGLFKSLVLQVAVGCAFAALILAVNNALTGDPLVFGYDLVNGAAHRPGYHVDPMGRAFTPRVGAYFASVYLTRLNTALFESPVPAVILVCTTMVLIRNPTRWDYLHLGIIAVTVGGYGAYWFNGEFVGPRFLYPAVPSFILFTARLGLEAAKWQSPTIRLGARLVVPACLIMAWAPIAIASRPTGVWKRAYAHRLTPEATQPPIARDLRDAQLTNALVFVREPLHARLAARLRALGMAPYRAERAAADLDACGLLRGLARSDAVGGPREVRLGAVLAEARTAGLAAPVRGLYGSRSLALAAGASPDSACASEIAADSQGAYAYEAFLAHATLGDNGRLGGPVVFARDLGPLNERLRERFGDRTWLRYRPGGLSSAPAFAPY